jgi:predicted PurR-regulated permease PerM
MKKARMQPPSPLLKKSLFKILLLLGIFSLLYLGKGVLVPLVVAALLALMLNPIHSWAIEQRGWKNSVATGLSLAILVLIFGGLFTAIGSQAVRFGEELPTIQKRVIKQYESLKDQISSSSGIAQLSGSSNSNSADSIQTTTSPAMNVNSVDPSEIVSGSQATSFLMNTGGVLANFLLVFVYVALLLSQKERLREFVLRRMPESERGTTHQTINESRDVAQQYLRGRLILIAILTVLYSVGFIFSGLDYAIVIALLVATLSIIPYLGNIIGGFIAIALSLTSPEAGTDQIYGIMITIAIAQFLESYLLTPLIVGKEVSINPLTTIIAVVAFNALWGPVGAVVAIPLVAILKIFCEHVKGLEDYAFLLGDSLESA